MSTTQRHQRLVPPRLKPGDHVRVVAPARSLALIGDETRAVADERFASMGLKLSFGDHVEEVDEFVSSSIESRVADLHAAFRDPSVDAILTVIGGHNSNQLLPYLDWDLIASNPKILCGCSDITALSCSIYARTGLVTYSGPHYSTFGMLNHFDQTLHWFTQAMFTDDPIFATPATAWSNDAWHLDQNDRTMMPNEGHWTIHPGDAEGTLVGGNLATLTLLVGTQSMPNLTGTVVFIEDDFESPPHIVDRNLTALTQQPGLDHVQGLLIGRFENESGIQRDTLEHILATKTELNGIPIIANMDFGHTDPILTLPVGGHATIHATPDDIQVTFTHT